MIVDGDYLIEKFIVADPDQAGTADARVAKHNVPVWALIGYLEAAGGDAERVARDYGISVDAVHAAMAYYRRHQQAIDARITENRAGVA